MITFDIIILITSIVFGITMYWLEAKNNGLYRSINKLTNSKELQMSAADKKGFIVGQGFMPRFIYVNIFLIVLTLIIFFIPIINIHFEYYISALIGIMAGIYIASFVISARDRSEELLDKMVDGSKDIIDDIKAKSREAASQFSNDETMEEEVSETPETPKKSARERLKDKGLLK